MEQREHTEKTILPFECELFRSKFSFFNGVIFELKVLPVEQESLARRIERLRVDFR
jgi:hypothetical protein